MTFETDWLTVETSEDICIECQHKEHCPKEPDLIARCKGTEFVFEAELM